MAVPHITSNLTTRKKKKKKKKKKITSSFQTRPASSLLKGTIGGPRGRVVKVADFSALDHSIISSVLVRASHGAEFTCGTSQVRLAGVSGGFPLVLRFSPYFLIDSTRYE